MKKILLLTFALIFVTSPVLADEFIVKSFKTINNKILTNDQKVYDDNDELCAIILVRTSLVNLGISASTPIVGSPKRTEGDIRVHLSAGTRMIKFFKDGFSTFEYVFPQRIEKGRFYILELEYRRTDVTTAGNTMGFVVINSQPAGAEVYINGEATGLQTPFQNPYNEGYYSFALKKTYYDDYKGDFTIKPGETTQKDITLKENYGSLSVSFNPTTNVSVNVDGKISAQGSPYYIEKLSPGKHTIALNKATYDEYTETFSISRGETTNLNIEMLANFGGITINTLPEINASISIDGTEYNNGTPFALDKLSPGKHSLSLSKPMYLTHREEFVIEKGRSKTFNITMRPNFGTISITAKAGDEIYIDKQKAGTATYSGKLLKGLHIIEVTRNNHYPQSRQVDIIAGSSTNEAFELLPITGTLQVMTTPIGADIYIDAKPQGQSPKFINNLIIGTYTLKLQKQGHSTIEKQVEITENQTTTINETLPNAVEVQITSAPTGAKLFVDGQYRGVTPQIIPLSFESHSFKLQKDEYLDFQSNNTIATTTNRLYFKMEAVVPQSIVSKVAGIELVFLKGGTFQMGSNDGEDDEKPVHKVKLDDFWICKYEITQKQWYDVMGNNPSYFKGCDNCPVENVSWDDVQDFIKKLNQKTGKRYRLPTEAEWEYAARCGGASGGYKYAGSNNIDDVAWYGYKKSDKKTHPVGQKKPNELGIYDMTGNVWEWCSDRYGSDYYKYSLRNNPQGALSGSSRVCRGGGWSRNASRCRVACRNYWNPSHSYNNLGFRLALVP